MWGVRPSSLVGMTDNPYQAFCFDEAVGTWGNFIVGELESVEGKTDKEVSKKRYNMLLKLLDAPVEKRFRSMKNLVGTKQSAKK